MCVIFLVVFKLAVLVSLPGVLVNNLEWLEKGNLARDLTEGLIMPIQNYQTSHYQGSHLFIGFIVAPLFLLFGKTSLSFHLVGIIFSVATFICWYYFFEKYFNKRTKYIMSFLYIFAPPLKDMMNDCDYVIHMAGIVHPKQVKEFYEVNFKGTKNILHEAVRSGIKKFIYVSSNSPAGFNKDGQLFSETDIARPYMHYGRSKYLAEQAVIEAVKEVKMQAVILRPCWFYGPGQPERQTKFFQMIKSGAPLLFGNGNSLRSLSYIDNTVQGIILALEKEGIGGQTYWIADEKPYTMREIYQAIAGLLNLKEFKPRMIPGWSSNLFEMIDLAIQGIGLYKKEIHVAGEMSRNIACSIEKAKKDLGYKPEVSLEEGMKRSIEWCRTNGKDI